MIDHEIPMINYVGHERNWKLHVRHKNESLLLDMYLQEIKLEATTFVLNICWIWKILWYKRKSAKQVKCPCVVCVSCVFVAVLGWRKKNMFTSSKTLATSHPKGLQKIASLTLPAKNDHFRCPFLFLNHA